ncbi:hypothetical protein GCM10011512_21560 [Tersicoccus solisilvae]|uniref:Class F sortase n=1 Tax=Tersicoccus solisilvae TaxID=1882339 RepID=A0ABQ1PBY9_9MICC|nr:class F sortase [Tersicoccus solisilvae]GGC94215.1 hypothetical protein GCM10011512_21560 [Tersicoccus solisilvae]
MSDTRSRRGSVARSAAAAVLTLGLASGVLAGCGAPAATEPAADAGGSTATATTGTHAPASSPSAKPTATATPTSSAKPTTSSPSVAAQRRALKASGPVLPASRPTRLDIPAIGVATDLIDLGRQDDGSAAVPPGEAGSPAGWYRYSPTPGAQGPAVILGHVNTTTIPEGVFFRLHEMTPGRQFTVTRADGRVAVFQVDRLRTVRKDEFPTLEVYGNTARSEIRLITCGDYEASSDRFEENTIVYAHLIGSRR